MSLIGSLNVNTLWYECRATELAQCCSKVGIDIPGVQEHHPHRSQSSSEKLAPVT